MFEIEGHAIVSADGMIGDSVGVMPSELRNDADWRLYQAALDRSVLVVLGRIGHERFPNPGRRRLVLTRSTASTAVDPADPLATLWNPAGTSFEAILASLGIDDGTVAVAGVFDVFAARFTRFVLSENRQLVLPGGTPCFAAGHPRTILTQAGLRPTRVERIDPDAYVTTTMWTR